MQGRDGLPGDNGPEGPPGLQVSYIAEVFQAINQHLIQPAFSIASIMTVFLYIYFFLSVS